MDRCADLLTFIDASPSPFHAVAEMARRLEGAGFTRLEESEAWSLEAGHAAYVVRDGGSIIAWRTGSTAPVEGGFRMVGAHTDSPTFRVRPVPDVARAGWRLLGCETYGGALRHTWLDRDLTLAGRVAVLGTDGTIDTPLVHLPGAPLRIPTIAIHLDRDQYDKGIQLNPQQHLVPTWGLGDGTEAGLHAVLAESLGVDTEAIVGTELVTADTQPSAIGGIGDQFIYAPRLDNLLSCHAGLTALIEAEPAAATQLLVANDHEEVGSRSSEGAAGSFLEDVVGRIVAGTSDVGDRARALARSLLVSCDCAHAVHPNYTDRHEAEHRPAMNGGPVIKHNANQAYATDAVTAGAFVAACRAADVPVQHFVTRGDMPCGSTIGPLTSTRLGLPTVDVGSAILSMHSVRELGGTADVDLMIRALGAHYT